MFCRRAGLNQRQPEIVVSIGIIRLEFYQAAKGGNGAFGVAGTLQHQAKPVLSLGEIRLQSD